jgi:hypothetical protein
MTVEDWFAQLKELGAKYDFAANNKQFKEWWYIGKVWDLAMVLRVWLAGSMRTPDLYSMMNVMWMDRLKKRLKEFIW